MLDLNAETFSHLVLQFDYFREGRVHYDPGAVCLTRLRSHSSHIYHPDLVLD